VTVEEEVGWLLVELDEAVSVGVGVEVELEGES
jgi:hypothetical protein